MTKNARMTDPGENAVQHERLEPGWETSEVAKARNRMKRICATPDEIVQYGYNPNGARGNLRPGIPGEDYAEPMDDSRD